MRFKRADVWGCIAVIAVFIFGASISYAQQAGGGGAPGGNPDIVGDWDTDGDGQVTQSEWQRSEALFTEYDTNGNGVIDVDERPQMPTSELMDADEDGKVSEAEFVGPAEFFKQLDKNGDGYLTEDDK